MNKYILEPIKKRELHAGTKAREDINYFLKELQYEPILFHVNDSTKFFMKVKNYSLCMLKLENILNKIENGSIILLQYPFTFNAIVIDTILKRSRRKNIKVIALIHDIEAIRFSLPQEVINREIRCLNSFDYVISHNPYMTKWLVDHGLKSNVIDLDVFDYNTLVMEATKEANSTKGNRILIFAGNLSPNKSGFLYKISDEIARGFNINLYGIEYEEENICCKNMFHKGSYQPEELPHKLEGDFGLIWDGTEIDTCAGHYGQYLAFNNPHKLSLYIAAGLPVITWKKAATASFLQKNRIGVLVDSLSEIGDAISEIDDDTYAELKDNVLSLQEKVIKGHYIKSAVRNIEEKFAKENINGL